MIPTISMINVVRLLSSRYVAVKRNQAVTANDITAKYNEVLMIFGILFGRVSSTPHKMSVTNTTHKHARTKRYATKTWRFKTG